GLGEQALAPAAAAQLVEQAVVGHAVEPRRRIVGRVVAPGLHRGEQGGLHRVLDELEVLHADPAGEERDQPAEVVAAGCHPGVWISMTSTPEPGRTRPGHSRATASASSRLAADTIM